jgi:hypothetical protein
MPLPTVAHGRGVDQRAGCLVRGVHSGPKLQGLHLWSATPDDDMVMAKHKEGASLSPVHCA